VDLVISNCVINLSPDKSAVLEGIYSVLKFGGEAMFSDVYCDRRLPDSVRSNKVLWGECLSGAMYEEDFLRMCHSLGFADPRVVERKPIQVRDAKLSELLGNAKFESVTYRLFKLAPGILESICEDYGQVATYLGTMDGQPHFYDLDDHHHFETGKPILVCGNSAAMVDESWIGKHFKVVGDRSVHYGRFGQIMVSAKHALGASSSSARGPCC